MKIWRLEDMKALYGERDHFIIRAETEMDARKIATAYCMDDIENWQTYKPDPARIRLWFAPQVVVIELSPDGEPAVLFEG